MSWAGDEMNAIHLQVQADQIEQAARYEKSVLVRDVDLARETAAGHYAMRAAAHQLIKQFWPNHPLTTDEMNARIVAAGRRTWQRTLDWNAVAKAGFDFPLPAFDYAKPFTQELETKLFSSQFNRGRAEARVKELEAEAEVTKAKLESQADELVKLRAEVNRLQAQRDEEYPRIIKLRSELLGIECDLARHMTIEHAFRARLEQLDPHSALVRDVDTRKRLADHGWEVFKATRDWTQVRDVGRSFVDYQAGSAFSSDDFVPPADPESADQERCQPAPVLEAELHLGADAVPDSESAADWHAEAAPAEQGPSAELSS